MNLADEMKIIQSDVHEAIAGISQDDLIKPHSIGTWSVRDVIIHMAMWDGEALKALAVWRTGHDYDWTYADDYLSINECWSKITNKLTATQAVQMYNLVRGALITDISSISNDIWEKRGGIPKWLSGITIEHNKWHLEKLQAYKKSLIIS